MRRKLILGSLLGFFAIAGAVGGLLLISDSSNSAAGSNRVVMVKSSADPLPLSDSALDSRGVTIFNSWSDARAAVDETTKAIIVTASTIPSADTKWIRDTVHGGIVIGAFNVSSASLAQAFGLYTDVPAPEGAQVPSAPVLDAAWIGDDPYFSLVLDVRTESHGRRGGMVERYLSTDQFFAHLERYISNAALR